MCLKNSDSFVINPHLYLWFAAIRVQLARIDPNNLIVIVPHQLVARIQDRLEVIVDVSPWGIEFGGLGFGAMKDDSDRDRTRYRKILPARQKVWEQFLESITEVRIFLSVVDTPACDSRTRCWDWRDRDCDLH
tara:strand:- start:1147 stop:1545 length:399 start_codon:yes stop_codon:yes gene_type:complete